MTHPDLHRTALECGAIELGETPQYIFNLEQLARFACKVGQVRQVPPCPVPAQPRE